jgi:hypothetical protein
MFTVTLTFCYLVALFLLAQGIQSYWNDRPRAQCAQCGTLHRERNSRRDGGGFKGFCSTVCFDNCMQMRWEHGLEGD